ncbi:hypothetical protein [Terriglobus tenax]|uniref:hypothetical protein n=1 Tax=Terriglobus tenax TaxID=1111115 RepID=UPI0021E074D1|nr:hypothetical protein [Terriglobus tenax]
MKKSMVLILFAVFAFAATTSLHAQLGYGVTFNAPFPFYAENTRLPAGNYRITQDTGSENVVLIESTDGKHAAFLDVTPTQTVEPYNDSAVAFHKYGNVEYLNRVWVAGELMGFHLDPTRMEKKYEAANAAQEHTVALAKR